MTTLQKRIWWALWPLGLAVAISAEYFSAQNHVPENHVIDALVGVTYMVTGLIAWRRRPETIIGGLMVAAGFAWFIGNFGNANQPVLFSLAHGFEGAEVLFIVHVLLTYPSGKLVTRPAKITLGLVYFSHLVPGAIKALTFDPARVFHDCARCIHGGLAFFPNLGVHDAADHIGSVIGTMSALIGVGIIISRYLRASPPARRALNALWLAGMSFALVSVAEIANNFVSGDPFSVPRTIAKELVPIMFLVGLMRVRFAEFGVGRFVIELGDSPPPGKLRDAMARTLGDPSLQIAFRVGDSEAYADVEGRPVTLPVEGSGRAVTFIDREGTRMAALIHDPALTDQRALVNSVAAAARLAFENERLQAEVRAQLQEVRASRTRIVEASDEARRRIERDLHDGAQQRLLSLALSLRMAKDRLADSEDPTARKVLEEAEDEMRLAVAELRELAQGIHPAVLTEQGLAAAVEALAEKAPLVVRVDVPAERFPTPVEATAYFVVSEALSNVFKYAGAKSVSVRAWREGTDLRIEVRDDGVGGASRSSGSGLRGLTDRVAALGGSLDVQSPPGNGTRVRASIPYA